MWTLIITSLIVVPSLSLSSGSSNNQTRILYDNFDSGYLAPNMWAVSHGTVGTVCGFQGTAALYFKGAPPSRTLMSKDFVAPTGARLTFFIKYGSGTAGCDRISSGQYVVVETQTGALPVSGAASSAALATISSSEPWDTVWSGADVARFRAAGGRNVSVDVPGYGDKVMRLRWRQVSFGLHGQDAWAVDTISLNHANVASRGGATVGIIVAVCVTVVLATLCAAVWWKRKQASAQQQHHPMEDPPTAAAADAAASASAEA